MKPAAFLPALFLLTLAACQPAEETGAPAATAEREASETVEAPAPADAPVRLVEQWKAEGFNAPEGVAAAPGGGYFISNVAGNGNDKDGAGWVSKISETGEVLEAQFGPTTMNAPKGMVVDRGILYVADLDRIHLINPDDGTLLKTMEIDGAEALNDMTAWNATLLASDSQGSKIWRISGDESGIWLEDERLSGVNGLTPDGDRLLVATMASGTLYEVNEAGDLTEIATGMENADGIGLIEGGYLVSSWPGQVWFVSEEGKVSEVLNTQEQGILQNDLTVFGNTVIIPNWMPGTVTAWTVEEK
ncbi:hypothetical protein [Henriciella sp.]|uniref:hypothetical protein n=1 Tax=Henriciella sp. TaxID=1968823 RepID=UPI002629517C|nr:hypothetical protein [Henriciella sp.]